MVGGKNRNVREVFMGKILVFALLDVIGCCCCCCWGGGDVDEGIILLLVIIDGRDAAIEDEIFLRNWNDCEGCGCAVCCYCCCCCCTDEIVALV